MTSNITSQDVADVQTRVDKATQEKNKLDQVLRSLNEQVVHQDDIISKLNKEKKYMMESQSKFTEELASNEDRFSHLNDVKVRQSLLRLSLHNIIYEYIPSDQA